MADAGKLHMIKLSVGSESVESLRTWQKMRSRERAAAGGDERLFHITRMTPKRRDELLDGGSIFWVIKGAVLARQRIVGLDPIRGADGISRCAIVLHPALVPVEPRAKKPFQGWRYLTAADAPADLSEETAVLADMPGELREALASFGVR